MGCLEVEEGGKVLSVDLKAEGGPKMEKVGAAVSRNNAEDRMWTEPSPCPTAVINCQLILPPRNVDQATHLRPSWGLEN